VYTKEDIVQSVKSSRLDWAGHAWITDGYLVKMVMVNQLDRKKPEKSPMQRWLDVVSKYLEELQVTTRLEWKLGHSLSTRSLGWIIFRRKELK